MSRFLHRPEQETLVAGYLGRVVPTASAESIDWLSRMGFVAAWMNVPGGYALRLTQSGLYLGRSYLEWHRWERWRDLYQSLQSRSALERDPKRRRILAKRSQRAYRRAAEAIARATPMEPPAGGAHVPN